MARHLTSRRIGAQSGFTLIDMALTLGIIVLVTMISVPSVIATVQTYRRNLASRQVLAEIRRTQSVAVARSDVFGLQWGGSVRRPRGTYRVVRDTSGTGSCTLPATEAAVDGTDVVRGWHDLASDYPGILIEKIEDRLGNAVGTLMFDSIGAAVDPCGSASYPVSVIVADRSGRTETIEIGRSGISRLVQ